MKESGPFFSKITVPPILKDSNVFTDPRDGQTYKTVVLKDGERWMAQNLNFDVGNGCSFYNNDPKNEQKYGRLYTWKAALKACPDGWHLPSLEEWRNLSKVYGWKVSDYSALIDGGDSGFSALLGGYRRPDDSFNYFGHLGYYWSSLESSSSYAWSSLFDSGYKSFDLDGFLKIFGISCRCLQD